MREIVLPEGVVPGSEEAVAYIESQVPPVYDGSLNEPAPEPAAVVTGVGTTAYELIIAGLEMMLDGFRELQND